MNSRSSATKAAQAAGKSASSQDKITFNIGSNKNGRKKAASAAMEPPTPNSDTSDYPNSGSSTGANKSSQLVKSSQDSTLANEIEESPSNTSLSLPSSGSSINYNAMKNSLTQGSISDSERLVLDSPEGVVGRVQTSTPQKRRLQKTNSDPKMTLQHIAEEVPVDHESNSEENIIESSQPDTLRILPENISGATKRKRRDLPLSDAELPDTLVTLQPAREMTPLKKCRQSVEIIGVRNKAACATPVVDLDDESDDDSDRLFLPQSQSQKANSASLSEELLRLSQHIPPILVDIGEDAASGKNSLPPASPSRQKTNGNSFSHNSSLSVSKTLPFSNVSSFPSYTRKNDFHEGAGDDVECLQEVPSSLRTFERVKQNLGMSSRMASPRILGRLGQARLNATTPPSAEIVNLDSDGHNTPENTNGACGDSATTYHSVLVLVNYKLSVNPVTKSCRREVVDCCVRDDVARKAMPPPLDDVSPGALADVSGQSKATSPASVTSTGLFPLAGVRHSMASTTSSGSTGTRQSIVSTVSSASATSAASLQEKNLLKPFVSSNALQPPSNAHNKFNSLSKSSGRDLRVEVCISDKQLIRLEAMSSLFESPMDSKLPAKKPEPTTNGDRLNSSEMSSCTLVPSESHQDKLVSTPLDESLPSTDPVTAGLSNGTAIHSDNPSPVPSPKPPAAKRSLQRKPRPPKKAAAKPVAEPCPETPKSSTKKRGARSQSTKKRTTGSRKVKMSPIVETLPPSQEVTPRDKKARVPAARKGLVLSPKPATAEKPTRRVVAAEESTVDDLIDPPISPDQPMLAFARWNDKRYYSCTVVGRTKDSKCVIKFDDGKSKSLAEEFVIPVGQLRKGLSVFAQVDEEEYESGTIFKLEVKDGVVMYVVELDSCKSVTIPRSALFLTEDQAKVLQEETWGYSSPSCQTRRPADVSLDNMVGGTRRRFASVVRRLPKVSGENRPPPTPTPYSDTSDDVNYANEDIYGIDVEFYPIPYPSLKDGGLSKAAGKVKGRGKDVATEKTTDLKLNELLGPIPEPGCKLFAGMQFLFTSVSTPSDGNVLGLLNESAYESATASEGEAVCRIPLFKERLVAQLEAGGGVVYDRFEQLEGYSETFLIASTPCQTAKYLLCLAHRVPIISHDWVISSIKAMKKQPVFRYLLQAGRNIVEGNCVDQKIRSSRDLILRNVDVLIVSDVNHFIGFWTKVLEAAGARVSSLTPDSDERPKETDVYVVLSDNSILGSKMRTWADNFGVRIVNPEWVKYCLIKGAKGDINLEQFSIEQY